MRNPLGQRLPRKFKINFSGCATDCGQAMFNDVGVIATTRTREDGTTESGFRVYIAGGLGANPHPALALEEFTAREDLLPTIEAILRVFEQTGNRDNKLRARMKWVVDTLGIDEVRRRVLKVRHTAAGLVVVARRASPRRSPRSATRRPVCPTTVAPDRGRPGRHRWRSTLARPVRALGGHQRHPRPGQRHGLGRAPTPRSATSPPTSSVRWPPSSASSAPTCASPTARTSCSAASPRPSCRCCSSACEAIGMARPGAELSRDVVACPGADTCNIAVTQSRGLAKAIGERLEEEGLAEVGGVRINISGCTNSCGQHHIADIGFFGAERRAHGKSAPGYQMLLGGYVGQEQIHFGDKALRLPAKNAPEAAARVVRRFNDERSAGEAFRTWMDRVGGATAVADGLRDLDVFPTRTSTPSTTPTTTRPARSSAEIGESECAV